MDNAFFNMEAVLAEFASASDRACAIVGGAFLDELLTELLQSFLVEDQKNDDKIFQGNGFLSTFSSRIDLCYRLGLIAIEEHKALHTVREIRNRFAHQLGTVTFMRQDIKSLCANIEMPIAMVAPKSIPLSMKGESPPVPSIEKADSSSPRAVFEESVITQMHVIAARLAWASISRRKNPSKFSSSVEVAHSTLTVFEQLLAEYDALLNKAVSISEIKPENLHAREKYQLLVKVQRFCIQQMEAVQPTDGNDS